MATKSVTPKSRKASAANVIAFPVRTAVPAQDPEPTQKSRRKGSSEARVQMIKTMVREKLGLADAKDVPLFVKDRQIAEVVERMDEATRDLLDVVRTTRNKASRVGGPLPDGLRHALICFELAGCALRRSCDNVRELCMLPPVEH